MPTYTYRARSQDGKVAVGTMEAGAKGEVADRLSKSGYLVTSIAEAKQKYDIRMPFLGRGRVRSEDMVLFSIQLANLIGMGTGLLASIELLAKQAENPYLAKTLETVRSDVEGGLSFFEALSRHPRVFSKLFITMVKAGEASGKLDNVLEKLAVFTEHDADLRAKVQSALLYPFMLFIAGILVVSFVIVSIIPNFVKIFRESNISLPLPTTILYALGQTINKYWVLIAIAVILAFAALRLYARSANGKFAVDRMKLRMPVFGPLIRKTAVSRFSRALATLISSGVPILASLEITEDILGNEVLKDVIRRLRGGIRAGEKIADPLKVSGEFPADAVQMISVGEETGNLDGMLNKVADFYDTLLGYSIKRLTAMLEPAFLVVIGAIVGLIMASVLMPMFDMVKTLRH